MQNARDSFYFALRERMAAQFPERTILVRSTERPAVLVEDAESPGFSTPMETFALHWTGCSVDRSSGVAVERQTCVVWYGTAGSQAMQGLDRGRACAALDAVLLTILLPLSTPKVSYAGGQAPSGMRSRVFWGAPEFRDAERNGNVLSREAVVEVFSFGEPGES